MTDLGSSNRRRAIIALRPVASVAAGFGPSIDAATNSMMDIIGKELRGQGRGGLADSRAMRAAVREVVRRNFRKIVDSSSATGAEPVNAVGVADAPSETMLMPLVVPPRQACRMLSIGLTRLYELLHEGQLESFRYGRSRRITTASILAYVERQLATSGGTTWEPSP